MSEGNIPVINISAKTIPEAWEKAVLEVWEHGAEIKTQYDKEEDTYHWRYSEITCNKLKDK